MDEYAAALAAVDDSEQAEKDLAAACFYELFDEKSTSVADVPPVDDVPLGGSSGY